MLPTINTTSPEPIKKPLTKDSIHRKSSFDSLTSVLYRPYVSIFNPRTSILIAILLIQLILFLTLRSVPVSHQDDLPSSSPVTVSHVLPDEKNVSFSISSPSDEQCPSGRVFVYDMPSIFNSDILKQCDNLNPWSSRCDSMSNDGFGMKADGLEGVVPESLIPAWYWTDQFVSEIIIHNRILNYKCRTMDPESAAAYYIPFYAGLAVGKYLWTSYTAKDRDKYCEMMMEWVQNQPYWNKSNGWDHFITMGRITWDFRRSKDEDWGSKCIYLPGMRNITRLLIERNHWDYFDVGVPYPTGFHPRSDSDVLQWQHYVRNRNRSTLFCFAGATRGKIKNDFRGLLLNHCKNESDHCRLVNCTGARCSNGSSAILETFLSSDFCLQPRGDSFTRRSIFDCMIAGSIPVFFWKRSAYLQYEWFLPSEPESYSVFIDRNDVINGTSIRKVLEKYSREEVKKMRNNVIDSIPKLLYARPHTGLETIKDAFDISMEGIFKRIKDHENWYKW